MTKRDRTDAVPTPPAAAPPGEHRSGRVEFDARGQAVWAWAVRTGLFDRNASTQRVRALTAAPARLEIAGVLAKSPGPPAANRNASRRPQLAAGESAGGDPYSRGPVRRPESVNFNPDQRIPGRKA
jgi:hypothetical protein